MINFSENILSRNPVSDSIEYKLALTILTKYIKNQKARKINYSYIEKQVKKLAIKFGYDTISTLTPFAVAEIIELGSVYTVFEN